MEANNEQEARFNYLEARRLLVSYISDDQWIKDVGPQVLLDEVLTLAGGFVDSLTEWQTLKDEAKQKKRGYLR